MTAPAPQSSSKRRLLLASDRSDQSSELASILQTVSEVDTVSMADLPDAPSQFADQKPLSAIAAEVRELADRAKSKKLKPEEYTGATFTISNLGMMDVHEFTAIINPPGAAILSVGSVRKEAVVGANAALTKAQSDVDRLYARWAELEGAGAVKA